MSDHLTGTGSFEAIAVFNESRIHSMGYDEIEKMYGKSIHEYLRNRVQNDADVGDIESRFWERIWTDHTKYDPNHPNPLSIMNWLRMIARHCVADYYKPRKKDIPIVDPAGTTQDGSQLSEIDMLTGNELEEYQLAEIDKKKRDFVHDELMPKCLSRDVGYPWQLVVFGLVHFVGLVPQKIVSDCSRTPIKGLVRCVLMTVVEYAFNLHDQQLSIMFDNLLDRMDKTVGSQVLPTDVVTRNRVSRFEKILSA